jgi:hypothetical protein
MSREFLVHLSTPHAKQQLIIDSKAKRKIVRAGRRFGKTVAGSILAIKAFLEGKRVLYAAPTQDQVSAFWWRITQALREPIEGNVLRKNETMHLVELEGTQQRIRAKTAWNADSLRGDFADLLILDEFQLMNEDAWQLVGAPMLMDNDGDAVFIYTPPSLHTRSVSKANDPQHAATMFKKHSNDTTGRWATFHFASGANPTLSRIALEEITQDMTSLAYRMEILAEDIDEAPGALWTREIIEKNRVSENDELDLDAIVVGIDPTGTAGGDEAGIIAAGRKGSDFYVLQDYSRHGRPEQWAGAAINLYDSIQANYIVAEINYGGEMVESTLRNVKPDVPYKSVSASRGKAVRAEPVAALYEKGRVHHVGSFYDLEFEMCMWMPGDKSPNRMDALVWAITELSTGFIRQKGDLGYS